MYHYVEDKNFVDFIRKDCGLIMKNLEEKLRNQGINTQYFLVGSGGRNMITQNESEAIDLDYNLNVISCEDSYINNLEALKRKVRLTFNEVLNKEGLRDSEDSTSSITSKKFKYNKYDTEVSIDICIVAQDKDGNWLRLIHNKTRRDRRQRDEREQYTWNMAPNSKSYSEKAKIIKENGAGWQMVRNEYINLKNKYLRNNNYDKTSFICYIEAINNIYNHMKQKNMI